MKHYSDSESGTKSSKGYKSSEGYLMSHVWLPVVKPLNARTEQDKEEAYELDKATHFRLKQLRKKPHNRTCADCGARNPGWCALPHGVFICVECAQAHRSLGRHISQTKSFVSGTYLWYPDELAAVESMGNARANSMYLGKPGGRDAAQRLVTRKDVEKHIREKYDCKWFLGRAQGQVEAADGHGHGGSAKESQFTLEVLPEDCEPTRAEENLFDSDLNLLHCQPQPLLLKPAVSESTRTQPKSGPEAPAEKASVSKLQQTEKMKAIMSAYNLTGPTHALGQSHDFFGRWGLSPTPTVTRVQVATDLPNDVFKKRG